jgi:hypothetical protein
MKSLLNAALLISALILGGCVTAPPKAVSLDQNVNSLKGAKVGVVMSAVPKPDTRFPGADCLFCLAAANIANASLTSHTKTLPLEDLPKLKAELAGLLREKGATVVELPDNFVVSSLPDASSKSENTARKDFSSLRSKYSIDKVVVLDITLLGMVRTYSAYFPTSDPKASLTGAGYMVNLSNNQYEWYEPVNISKGSDGKWDEPPKFPGLTNAYFQALELGKDVFLKPFKN